MTETELRALIDERMIHHTAALAYGYSSGKLEVDEPDRPITQIEWRTTFGALQLALIDAMVALGLTSNE